MDARDDLSGGEGTVNDATFPTTKTLTFRGGDGLKRVKVTFFDDAGNVRAAILNLTLDSTAPTVDVNAYSDGNLLDTSDESNPPRINSTLVQLKILTPTSDPTCTGLGNRCELEMQ